MEMTFHRRGAQIAERDAECQSSLRWPQRSLRLCREFPMKKGSWFFTFPLQGGTNVSTSSGDESDLILTAVDVRRAAAENVLSTDDAEQLLRWAQAQRTSSRLSATAPREKAKGLNMVMVAYYFGAMLMIDRKSTRLNSSH